MGRVQGVGRAAGGLANDCLSGLQMKGLPHLLESHYPFLTPGCLSPGQLRQEEIPQLYKMLGYPQAYLAYCSATRA